HRRARGRGTGVLGGEGRSAKQTRPAAGANLPDDGHSTGAYLAPGLVAQRVEERQMRLGVMTTVLPRPSIEAVADAVRAAGLAAVQLNLECAGLEPLREFPHGA